MTPEVEGLLESGRRAGGEGDLGGRLVRVREAVELAGNEALPRLRLGTLCHRVRDYPRARDLLEEARRLDPDNSEVAFRLGLTCEALGERELAPAASTP